MSQVAIIGILGLVVMCSSSSVAMSMMGGEEEPNLGPTGSLGPSSSGFSKRKWQKISGGLKQVDIDGDTTCGVNSNDNIYCKTDLTSSSWVQLPGGLKYVSVSNGKLYGVNSDNEIWYKPDTTTTGNWEKISGSLNQVDIDGDTICGVDSSDKIKCKTGLTSSNWVDVPGSLNHVSVSNGKFYGVKGNEIYYSP